MEVKIASTGTQVWTLNRKQHCRFRQFDEEGVLYDSMTGDSHFFSELSALVIGSLFESHRSIDELCDAVLAKKKRFALPNSLREALEDTLFSLKQRGLTNPRYDAKKSVRS